MEHNDGKKGWETSIHKDAKRGTDIIVRTEDWTDHDFNDLVLKITPIIDEEDPTQPPLTSSNESSLEAGLSGAIPPEWKKASVLLRSESVASYQTREPGKPVQLRKSLEADHEKEAQRHLDLVLQEQAQRRQRFVK